MFVIECDAAILVVAVLAVLNEVEGDVVDLGPIFLVFIKGRVSARVSS